MMQVGMIGVANFGGNRRHLLRQAGLFRIAAVCDRSPEWHDASRTGQPNDPALGDGARAVLPVFAAEVAAKQSQEFTTADAGLPHVARPDGTYQANTRFSLDRWHITDPVRFKNDLGVTRQAIGWRSGGRYLPNQDDIAPVAFWYQTEPHAPFPNLPDRDGVEII